MTFLNILLKWLHFHSGKTITLKDSWSQNIHRSVPFINSVLYVTRYIIINKAFNQALLLIMIEKWFETETKDKHGQPHRLDSPYLQNLWSQPVVVQMILKWHWICAHRLSCQNSVSVNGFPSIDIINSIAMIWSLSKEEL